MDKALFPTNLLSVLFLFQNFVWLTYPAHRIGGVELLSLLIISRILSADHATTLVLLCMAPSRLADLSPSLPLAIARAKEAMGVERTVQLALDVACGTGQSAAALTSIAERVIGFDISWSMLANAERNERVRYVKYK